MKVAMMIALAALLGAQAPAKPDPKSIKFVGDRFKPLTWEEMSPAQRTMVEDLVSGPRSGAGGPFNVLLRSPEMGNIAQKFGASMRFNPDMPRKLNEMAIIITARYWTAQYEWYAHKRAALAAGLNPAIVEAIHELLRQAPARENAPLTTAASVPALRRRASGTGRR